MALEMVDGTPPYMEAPPLRVWFYHRLRHHQYQYYSYHNYYYYYHYHHHTILLSSLSLKVVPPLYQYLISIINLIVTYVLSLNYCWWDNSTLLYSNHCPHCLFSYFLCAMIHNDRHCSWLYPREDLTSKTPQKCQTISRTLSINAPSTVLMIAPLLPNCLRCVSFCRF